MATKNVFEREVWTRQLREIKGAECTIVGGASSSPEQVEVASSSLEALRVQSLGLDEELVTGVLSSV